MGLLSLHQPRARGRVTGPAELDKAEISSLARLGQWKGIKAGISGADRGNANAKTNVHAQSNSAGQYERQSKDKSGLEDRLLSMSWLLYPKDPEDQ